jgi:hypothetical protein
LECKMRGADEGERVVWIEEKEVVLREAEEEQL